MTQTAPQAVEQPGISSISTLMGWLMVVLSLVVLVGCFFDMPALTSFVPESDGMKANSALALMFGAVSLLRRDYRDRYIYSILPILIGSLTLGEYLRGSNFGIDQLLVRDTHYFQYAGRPSQYTSFVFVLLGLSLLLMKSRSRMVRYLSRVFAALTGTLGLIALASHAYATPVLNRIGPYRNVAVPTALGFTMGAIGVHYANPFEGFVRLFHARNAGGKMLRRLLPAGLVAAMILGFLVTSAKQQFRWESGFSMVLLGFAVAACLISVIVFTAVELEREELARRETEHRFRLAANSAPVMIWSSGTDRLCDYFNDRWLQFTGRKLEEELGNGWAEGVHPEDLDECLSTYVGSFDGRKPFQMQYRLRRHDGEFRWVFDTGVPRFIDDSFSGYIGSCIDVTERKRAEETLADLPRQVFYAQEEERSRIARELHDDINQRIAMLVWELSELAKKSPNSGSGLRNSLDSVNDQLRKVVADIQSISRRLHAADLEYLGFYGAARALCRETAEQQTVSIDFKCDPSLPRLPNPVSLCLYRVLQEALQNAIKHSGVGSFEVEITGSASEVWLSVRDSGVGFDTRKADNKRGLGLISMRERMRLVHGEFAVESQPGQGTTVTCRAAIEYEDPEEHLDDDQEKA
jgi:PAS domain S-box-containing protein